MWPLLITGLLACVLPGIAPKETIYVTRIEMDSIVRQLRQSPNTRPLAVALHRQLFDEDGFWLICDLSAYSIWREEIRKHSRGVK